PQVTATQVTANVDPALAARIAAIPGIARVVTGRNVDLIAPDYPTLPPVRVTAATGEVVATERPFLWLNAPNGDYWAALESGALVVSEPFAFRRGITPENAQITLLTDRGEQTFPIVGVYYDYSTDQGIALMADSVYRRYYADPFITSIAVFLEPDADLNAALETIRTEAIANTELLAQSNRSLRSGVFDVFERTFAITGALRMLAVVVAFIGILSALMALQLEQTRQYGTMRAVGMTPRQLWRFTLLQTGLMGGTAGLLALPIGAALAWVLIYVINLRSFGWTLQLTLTADEFALAFIVALAAALLAG
ncbi:MAG: ABC transporter substrate-binding protein, partial [Phototrophicales bacterium]